MSIEQRIVLLEERSKVMEELLDKAKQVVDLQQRSINRLAEMLQQRAPKPTATAGAMLN